MQLLEVLDEKSIKDISQKTMISEQNIELLIAEDFSSLPKAKAIGFISILERDYSVDLGALRKIALDYYSVHENSEENMNIILEKPEREKGRSIFFPLLVLSLLAYASWYFFTQFDKKMFSDMIPFTQQKNTILSSSKENLGQIKTTDIEPKSIDEKSKTTSKKHSIIRNRKIILLPEEKLWFGLIDMETADRDQNTIDKQYKIDVTRKSWLLATSAANFALINHNDTQEYNDGKKHYFKVSNKGVEPLSRDEYVAQGGYKRW